MSGKLKVYGINTFERGVQVRTIAATTSQREFAILIGTGLNYVREYGSETGNLEELTVAMAEPNTVFYACKCCGTWLKSKLRPPQGGQR